MEEYKVGDIIRLNSGGPLMTISEVKSEYVSAQWFTDTAEPHLKSDSFYLNTFKKVSA